MLIFYTFLTAQKYYKKDNISLKLPIKNLIKLDKRFEPIVKKFGIIELENQKNPYHALVRAIIYQQLSVKAASTIYKRFLGLFNNKIPPNYELINTPHKNLRIVGISNRKVEFIKSIAEFFEEHSYTKKDFEKMTNDEIRVQLINVRGIGHWTVDMFLMFTLHRLDIFPVSDLGIQKGFAKFYGLQNLPSEEIMLNKSKRWKPYQSVAAHYFWRVSDEDK